MKPADINRANRRGRTALHEAVRAGQQASLDTLLNYIVDGCALADVNACDDQKWTPLHMAAFNGMLSMVLQLIQAFAHFSC